MGWQEIKNIKQAAADKKPRTRYINPKSEKRFSQDIKYIKLREAFLRNNPLCVFPGCTMRSRDVHHSIGKVGKNYLNEKTFVALCRAHHTFVELNPKIARQLLLSNSRLKKA